MYGQGGIPKQRFDGDRAVQYKEIKREIVNFMMMFSDQFVCHIEIKMI